MIARRWPLAITSGTALAPALDAACVVAFVAAGRRNHDEDPGLAGTLVTAAPFLIALAVAWMAIPAVRRAPSAPGTGIAIRLVTAAGGLLLRRLVFDRGIALPFVIVATVVLGALLVGWRAHGTYLRHAR